MHSESDASCLGLPPSDQFSRTWRLGAEGEGGLLFSAEAFTRLRRCVAAAATGNRRQMDWNARRSGAKAGGLAQTDAARGHRALRAGAVLRAMHLVPPRLEVKDESSEDKS